MKEVKNKLMIIDEKTGEEIILTNDKIYKITRLRTAQTGYSREEGASFEPQTFTGRLIGWGEHKSEGQLYFDTSEKMLSTKTTILLSNIDKIEEAK